MKKILLVLLFSLLAVSCNKTEQPKKETFTGTWYSGYEGYFTDVSYSLSYDPSKATIVKNSENSAKITDIQTKKDGRILFFNNDGAGFSSSEEVWKEYFQKTSGCTECTTTTNILSFNPSNFQSPVTNMITFENLSEYWIISKVYPGYIAIMVPKPIGTIKEILETLTWHYTKIQPT
ncbi:MAG: hypothetical protein G01um101477_39 [Candidatus Doudnabacteria bacterium Gr01-1014_77]|uniref:Lipocalin-like domain-containing protein n=1 Tax=Candidatus Doudnabacteria bacterium Gr01-1014_77 TaxID=2017133 RepID=A0A554JE57_9BACT|nr:MAG: hypothetical protein G01um101477_39 [Candidatus Doudnabacteria bacterium Gr01-1014_77]